MRWANLTLDYLKVLTWPAVVMAGLLIFRRPLTILIPKAKRVSAFGAEAEFIEIDEKIARTEAEIAQEVDVTKQTPSAGLVGGGADLARTVRSLLTFDPAELDAKEPTSAATEIYNALQKAITATLHHFEIPASAVSSQDAGRIMELKTGIGIWPEFMDLFREQGDMIRDLTERSAALTSGSSDSTLSLEAEAKQVVGWMFRLSRMLPNLVQRSLVGATKKRKRSWRQKSLGED